MESLLTSAERRALKARAQLLEPMVRLGREGTSEAFYTALEDALTKHQLVKVKFGEFKEERKQMAAEIAERSASELVVLVGHVAVYYRPAATPPEN